MSEEKITLDGIMAAVAELRTTAEQNNKSRDAVTEDKLSRLNTVIDGLEEKMASFAKVAARPSEAAETKTETKAATSGDFLRKGYDRLTPAEIKSLSVGVAADGGNSVPQDLSLAITQRVFDTSPIRQYSQILTTFADHIEFLAEANSFPSGWVAETAARPATGNMNLPKYSIYLSEQYAMPVLTRNIIEDSALDIVSWVATRVGEQFARDEAVGFISGTGVNQPTGLLTYVGATSAYNSIKSITSGTSAKITTDDLISLQTDLQVKFKQNAKFFMTRFTEGTIRTLKDNYGGYLWQPSVQAGVPNTFAGSSVVICEDLPGVAAGNVPVLYGDMARAYAVIDKTGSTIVIRDEYTNKPYINLYFRRRVGGGLLDGQALRALTIKA